MRKLAIAFALLLLAAAASAQMHRPGDTTTMGGPMHFAVAADGSLVFLATANKIVALSAASGNVAWTLEVGGYPMQLEARGSQLFVMVTGVDTTTMPVSRVAPSRTMVAISNTGTVLWSKKID